MNPHQNDGDMRITTSTDVLLGLQDRIAELEAQLETVGAGGVSMMTRTLTEASTETKGDRNTERPCLPCFVDDGPCETEQPQVEGLVMHVTKSAEQHAKESAEYMEMLNKYLPVVGLFAADHEGYKGHDSDCSVHNEPAFPAGPCDCRLSKAAPKPQQIAEPASKDTERLDWLETQGVSYGFEDLHEGNRWTIEGPFRTLRTAIDECMSDTPKEQS